MPGTTATRRYFAAAGLVVVGAGLVAAPPAPALRPAAQLIPQPAAIRLAGGHDTPLGGGTALIMGPSLISTPSQRYVDTVNALYLQPHGFTEPRFP